MRRGLAGLPGHVRHRGAILILSKRSKTFWDNRLAVCCAHNLFAESEQIPHLQTEKCFLRRTRRRKKRIKLALPPACGKLCEAFVPKGQCPFGTAKKSPAAWQPGIFAMRFYAPRGFSTSRRWWQRPCRRRCTGWPGRAWPRAASASRAAG